MFPSHLLLREDTVCNVWKKLAQLQLSAYLKLKVRKKREKNALFPFEYFAKQSNYDEKNSK